MPDESEIRDIENKRANAQLNHDLSFFIGLFSSEFVATNPYNKVVNREQVLEIFKKLYLLKQEFAATIKEKHSSKLVRLAAR